MADELLTVRQVANELNLRSSTIRRYITAGELQHLKIGPENYDARGRDRRNVRIRRSDLTSLVCTPGRAA